MKWRTLNIELHYLPPYSQNLNLMERFWKVMNEHVRRNVTFPKIVGSLASLLIIFRF
ncbi:transposase [Aeromonas jandaei]|uniref:Transposase n=1 Tax=Aeromonas jandaei TaxID=650 RepID=A0ABD7EMU2_AERJA|nr:transposase [Aeromonas jandaei]